MNWYVPKSHINMIQSAWSMAQEISLAAAQCYHTPEATEADVVNSWLKRPPRLQRA